MLGGEALVIQFKELSSVGVKRRRKQGDVRIDVPTDVSYRVSVIEASSHSG